MSPRTLIAAALLLAGPARADTAFDGTWNVIFSCTAAQDGAAPYSRRFLATVRNGVLHGEVGTRGQPGWLALDGAIPPNGQAMLTGQGLTGDPQYVVGRLSPASPYSFHLRASFTGDHGTGARVETRPCDAVFTR